MNPHGLRLPPCVLTTLGAVLLGADQALGCAVCFGNAESQMAKGVMAGVFFMVGVVGFVLLGVAGTSLFWIQRGRRMAREEDAQHNSAERPPDHDS